jgi:hypothetical protein
MKGKTVRKAKAKKSSKVPVKAGQKKMKLKDLPKKQRNALLFLPALIAQKGMEAPKFTENAVVVFKYPNVCSITDGKNKFSALFKENATYCSAGGSRIIRIAGSKIEKI